MDINQISQALNRPMNAFKGICLGMIISLALWMLIALGLWWWFFR